jgi:hypothetical protein
LLLRQSTVNVTRRPDGAWSIDVVLNRGNTIYMSHRTVTGPIERVREQARLDWMERTKTAPMVPKDRNDTIR